MDPLVLLVAGSEESNVTAWDVKTGSCAATYKNNACSPGCFTAVGSDYLASAQNSKGSPIHLWSWEQESVHARSFPPEPLTALCASPCGSLIVGGARSGRCHLWASGSGRLLASWPAHFKSVTTCAFDASGSLLATGSDDCQVHVWSVCEVADNGCEADLQGGLPCPPSGPAARQALRSWSDHSLAVTAVALGSGGAGSTVYSCGLDRTLSVRSLADGACLLRVALPAALACLAVEALETFAVLGADDGSLFVVDLVGGAVMQRLAGSDVASGRAQPRAGVVAALPGLEDRAAAVSQAHGGAVSSVALCQGVLASGAADGSVRLFDALSMQALRGWHVAGAGGVAGLMLGPQPLTLKGKGGAAAEAGRSESSAACPSALAATLLSDAHALGAPVGRVPAPLSSLAKFPNVSTAAVCGPACGAGGDGPVVVLRGTGDVAGHSPWAQEPLIQALDWALEARQSLSAAAGLLPEVGGAEPAGPEAPERSRKEAEEAEELRERVAEQARRLVALECENAELRAEAKVAARE